MVFLGNMCMDTLHKGDDDDDDNDDDDNNNNNTVILNTYPMVKRFLAERSVWSVIRTLGNQLNCCDLTMMMIMMRRMMMLMTTTTTMMILITSET